MICEKLTLQDKIDIKNMCVGSGKVYLNPVFTYGVDGMISRIDYTNGYKVFTYVDGVLSSINIDGVKTKTFTYDDNGVLISITETSA